MGKNSEILVEKYFHKNKPKQNETVVSDLRDAVNKDIHENQDPEILTIRTSQAKVEVDVE